MKEKPWEFALPTRVHFGGGVLRKLGEIVAPLGRSAVLLGYGNEPGLEEDYDRAARILRAAGIAVTTLFTVPAEPDGTWPGQVAAAARDAGADMILGLGGGSVIDTAKGAALLARKGGQIEDYLGRELADADDALPIVAIPTTAGTGTEVSDIAVFTQPAGAAGRMPYKASLYGPALRPRIAVVDPELAEGTPAAVTAACGADALAHAIEACVSRRAQPIASLLARHAVGLIVEHLPRAVAAPGDAEPREPLALASLLAGVAFSTSGVVVTHALAHALGALLNVPHAQAVAAATPVVLRWNREACAAQYAALAQACHIDGPTPDAQADRFVESIAGLLRQAGLPATLPPPAGPVEELLDHLVQNALESTRVPIQLNPRRVRDADLRGLFREVLGWPAEATDAEH